MFAVVARPQVSFAHEDPFDLVKRIPIGSKLRWEARKPGGFWFARTPFAAGVKSRKVYVGSDANKALVERAWAIVEATPEVRRLRELGVLGPSLARAAGDVQVQPESPQQVLRFAAGERAGGRRRPKR
jgi:hypothetical protein